MRLHRLFALAGSTLFVAACTPSLDWRQVPLDGTTSSLMPCKPDRVARPVTVAERTAQGTMWVCDAGGFGWSVTLLRFANEEDAASAVIPVAQALADNLRADLPSGGGSPSADGASRWTLTGRRPDGRPVRAWARFSRQGGQVLQQVVLGPDPSSLPADAEDSFLRDPQRSGRP